MTSCGTTDNELPPTERTPLVAKVRIDCERRCKEVYKTIGRNDVTCDTDIVENDTMHENESRVVAEALQRCRTQEPSRGRKAAVLISCWLLQMLSNGLGFGMGVMYVELVRVFERPRTETALVQAIYMAVMVGGGFIFTPLVMRYGPGPCFMVASLAACLGFIASSYSISLPMLIAFTGIVSGLGMSVSFFCTFITVSWIFHSKPGALLVFVTTGSSIGQFLFPYLNEILITEVGWRGTFFIMGAVALNCIPIGLVVYTSRKYYKTGSDETGTDASDKKPRGIFDITLFKDPIVMFFLFNGLILDLTGMFESWFIVDIMVSRGYEREVGAFLLQLTGIANFIGRGSAVALKIIFNITTVCHWIYICLLIAASHFMIVLFHNYWLLFAASLIYGFSFGVICAQVPVIMFEIAGLKRYPQGMALLDVTFGIADLFCGLVGGLINDVTGSYTLFLYIAFGISIYVAIASILLTYFVRRSQITKEKSGLDELAPLIHKEMEGRVDKKYLRLTNRRGTVF